MCQRDQGGGLLPPCPLVRHATDNLSVAEYPWSWAESDRDPGKRGFRACVGRQARSGRLHAGHRQQKPTKLQVRCRIPFSTLKSRPIAKNCRLLKKNLSSCPSVCLFVCLMSTFSIFLFSNCFTILNSLSLFMQGLIIQW